MKLDEVISAEQQLLGSLVMDPSIADLVGDSICEEDFAGPGHGRAWSGILDLAAAGGPVSDPAQVVKLLRQIGVLEQVGGVAGVGKWSQAFPKSAMFYAGQVRRASQSRRLNFLATEIGNQVELGKDPGEIAAWLSCQLDSITGERGIDLKTIGEAAREALSKLDEARAKGIATGRETGLSDLDGTVGGLFDGDMVVVAARPSVGKSALAVQIGMHVAKNSGPVLLVSLEMRGRDLALRLISRDSGVSMMEIRAATIDDHDRGMIGEAVAGLDETNLVLLSARQITTAKIRAAARLQRASGGLSMVIVDYLGLVKPTDWRKPRYEQIAEASSAMKDLALELDVPVMVLSQLNRSAEKEKPLLSHLRDSGAVEQDADVVWLLHRESKGSREATIEIAKNRQGATGTVELMFDPPTTTFSSFGAKDMPNYESEFDGYSGEVPF